MSCKRSLILCGLLLGACGGTGVVPPDASNPAHCIAAFHYGRQIALGARPPAVHLAVQSTARAIHTGRKLKAEGRYDSAQADAERLLAAYAGDGEAMMALLRDCMLRQDADPNYRALNDSGALMAAARKVDPSCRQDAECRARIR